MGGGFVPTKSRGYYCPICENDDPDFDEDEKQGDVICRDCGCVMGTIISEGSEWRSFASDGNSTGVDHNRVGAAENPLLQARLERCNHPSPSLHP